MAELLSIKERIERRYVSILQGISGIGRVYRWDGRGLRDPVTGLGVDSDGKPLAMKSLDALIIAHDEDASDGSVGGTGGGTTIKRVPIEVQVKITLDEHGTDTASQVHNRWLLKIETALMANPSIQEANVAESAPLAGDGHTGERLAIDTRVTATGQPPREEGQREVIAGIQFETTYEHYRDDPAAAGYTTHWTA